MRSCTKAGEGRSAMHIQNIAKKGTRSVVLREKAARKPCVHELP